MKSSVLISIKYRSITRYLLIQVEVPLSKFRLYAQKYFKKVNNFTRRFGLLFLIQYRASATSIPFLSQVVHCPVLKVVSPSSSTKMRQMD